MIEMIIDGLIATLPQEQLKQIKNGFSKVDEFLPVVDAYHAGIKMLKEKDEIRVAYLLGVEKSGKTKELTIMLRQIVLGANESLRLPVISRTLGEWDVLAKAKEITDKM